MVNNTKEHGLSRVRLTMLRLAYAPLAVGLALIQLPLLAEIGPDWEIMHGIVICMLGALCILSIAGLFRPVEMLPILLFEVFWKLLWLGLVAFPAWLTGSISPSIAENLFACLLVVPIMAFIPWSYAVQLVRFGYGERQ